ncbi:uroporphyrinogen decarboxylase [Helicosporidium sp. ATCC 50920]|nr:uroporphyrinogen decarboxylase [Helicosporidium sp. ATCC 50920]|eukprot:KDD76172.1 uroporphyrinogen decarboxylase [Helicosporidium sp. ATCC 50920]
MKAYKDLAAKYPSFRERSERAELAVEISLQPWHAFKPDGVILFSDILTPLPALGVPFDVHDKVGPILATPIRQHDQVVSMPSLDLSALEFVSAALRTLRAEVPASTAVLGFVGSPWTVGTYCVEGGSSTTYKTIKSMALSEPATLHALLQNLARAMAAYACFQAASGADYLMIFDSWGGHLSPRAWDKWSAPYLRHVIQAVKKSHPRVPVCLFVNGGAGLLERMKGCGADVVGLDSFVDMADARRRLGAAQPVQGNVDPVTLFGPRAALEAEIRRCVADAGGRHILNLGHGVMVGTPERAVADMFDIARTMTYAS